MNDRFSVIILCYRNFQYLLPAIDSVLEQDYSDIELIISDDCSDAFPAEEICAYIQNNKHDNITNFIIRQQAKNGGTVKHLNGVVPVCTGKYVIVLAGDDVFHNPTVLSTYAKEFGNAPVDCFIEMAHTGMYDNDLRQLQEYYLKLPVQNAIEKTTSSSSNLLELLVTEGACLPTNSTCFKREFFDRFGKFDEKYILVEDYPMHLRLAKEGWKIHYANFIAIKHRDGGISHGQIDASSKSAKLYYRDTINMLQNIVLPEVDKLPKAQRKNQILRIKKQIIWLESILAKADKNLLKMLCVVLKHPFIFFELMLCKVGAWTSKWHEKMIGLTMLIWFFNSTISDMLEKLFLLETGSLIMPLYYISSCILVIWIISFSFMAVYKVIQAIVRMPNKIY